MMKRTHFGGPIAIAILATITAVAHAQETAGDRRQPASSGGENAKIQFPPGDSILAITADAPSEARVGQSFNYQIRVENISDNIAVHELVILQDAGDEIEIQTTQTQGTGKESDAGQTSESSPDRKQNAAVENDSVRQSRQVPGERGAGLDLQSDQQHGKRWTIDRLQPGQVATINVTAVSDSEGAGKICLAIESYKPSICIATKFTKPDLEIVKSAPEAVDLCDEIKFEYAVTNSGSGDLATFTVRDELPEGLQTIEGENKLEFALEDGLRAGEVRKFVASLMATRAGNYTSRAMVQGEGVKAQSNRAGTLVQQGELVVAIDGPRAQEVGGLANYTVRVTNHGDAPAPDATLKVFYPRSADLVQASDPQTSSRNVPESAMLQRDDEAKQNNQPVARTADPELRSDQNVAQIDSSPDKQSELTLSRGDRNNMGQREWELGTLAPGATMEATFTLRPFEGGQLRQMAVAQYVCSAAQDQDMLVAQTAISTQILKLPGLRLTVIDDHDPVPSGENVTYTITVLNQGKAPARDIQIAADLPKDLHFVSAGGATSATNATNEITFQPVSTLAPGDKAEWQVKARVGDEVGSKSQTVLNVELNSADLDEAVKSEEPTTLFNESGTTASAGDVQIPASQQRTGNQ